MEDTIMNVQIEQDRVAELTRQLNSEKARERRAEQEVGRSSRILTDSRRTIQQLENELKSLQDPFRPSIN